MKRLMETNIYDVDEVLIVVGSCLKFMQPKAFFEIEKISSNIYSVCLEETHVNMVITKVGGILRTGKVKKIVFVSVDKSPHCIQMHYIQDELKKMMNNLENIIVENYVAVDNRIELISPEVISLSKNLSKLSTL